MSLPSTRQVRHETDPPFEEVTILWLSAGLGCDGETIAMTAASQPSLEDVLGGAIPWLPKVRLHNPFLSMENGDEFLEFFHRGEKDTLGPFILVMEGSIPNETNKSEGYWAAFGSDPVTEQPITTCRWIDRLAPNAWAVVAVGTCAAYGGIHAMQGNPTDCMGLPDYLGWGWKSKGGLPIVCVPGCPTQPDNIMETLLYLLYMSDGIELLKTIRLNDQALPILVLSMHDETVYAERALRAGANGYIVKQEATEKILVAIRRILNHEVYVSERISNEVLHQLVVRQSKPQLTPIASLSDRELEVFRLLGFGHATREIAEELHLSVKTIESYQAHIKDKLALRTARAVMQRAIEWRLSEPAS